MKYIFFYPLFVVIMLAMITATESSSQPQAIQERSKTMVTNPLLVYQLIELLKHYPSTDLVKIYDSVGEPTDIKSLHWIPSDGTLYISYER